MQGFFASGVVPLSKDLTTMNLGAMNCEIFSYLYWTGSYIKIYGPGFFIVEWGVIEPERLISNIFDRTTHPKFLGFVTHVHQGHYSFPL